MGFDLTIYLTIFDGAADRQVGRRRDRRMAVEIRLPTSATVLGGTDRRPITTVVRRDV